jgi:hypothetical protein
MLLTFLSHSLSHSPPRSTFYYKFRQTPLEPVNINISRIKMSDYEQHHYDKETLKQSATTLFSLEVNLTLDLEAVRVLINKMCDENSDPNQKLAPDWCFIDCKYNIILFYSTVKVMKMISQHAQQRDVFVSIRHRRICIMSPILQRM